MISCVEEAHVIETTVKMDGYFYKRIGSPSSSSARTKDGLFVAGIRFRVSEARKNASRKPCIRHHMG